jgi:hypothetical protein
MSTISQVSSGSSAQLFQSASSVTSGVSTPQNLTALATALESGDLSQAQSALTALSAGGTGVQPFRNNVQADSDYNSVVVAVESGNFSAADAALSNLQTALHDPGSADSGSGLGRLITAAYAPSASPTPAGHQLEVTV